MGFISSHSPLLLRVFHTDGVVEHVIVHSMTIGSGKDDLVSVPAVPPGFGTILQDFRGTYILQVGEKGMMILVEPHLSPTSRLPLSPGVVFRLGETRFECVGHRAAGEETSSERTSRVSRRRGNRQSVAIIYGLVLGLCVLFVLARESLLNPWWRANEPERSDPVSESEQKPTTQEPAENGIRTKSSSAGKLELLQRIADRHGSERDAILADLADAPDRLDPPLGANPPDKIGLLRLSAGLGDVDAQFRLAEAYYHGDGVVQDYGEAVAWYRKASDMGHSGSTYSLARCLEFGIGAPRDEVEALRLYELAASGGLADASFRAGVMLEDGRGTAVDEQSAFRRYEKAAKAGSVEAMVNLGLMYAQGRACKRDEKKALTLYRKAAEQGDKDALVLAGMMYEFGLGTERNRELAVKYYQQAVARGDREAQYYLNLLN